MAFKGCKKTKIMDIHYDENDPYTHIVVYYEQETVNPYQIYKVWWDGERLADRKRLLTKYADIQSVAHWMKDFMMRKICQFEGNMVVVNDVEEHI